MHIRRENSKGNVINIHSQGIRDIIKIKMYRNYFYHFCQSEVISKLKLKIRRKQKLIKITIVSKVRSSQKQIDILTCAGKYITAFLYLKEYYFHAIKWKDIA